MASIRVSTPERRDRLWLLNAFTVVLPKLLGAAGQALGYDRHLKSNTSKQRTHSLFRQGAMLYELIPTMPEPRLRPLIERFGAMLLEIHMFAGVYGTFRCRALPRALRKVGLSFSASPGVSSRLNWSLGPEGEPDDEAEAVYGRADHWGSAGARAGCEDGRSCRKHGISEATFYNWKSKFGGMDLSEARRLKQLEGENVRLKKLLADSIPDNAATDLLSKNGDARCQARGRRPSSARDERAAGTTRGWHVSRDLNTGHVAFRGTENISTPNLSNAAQYLACTLPCECFTSALAESRASLGAGAVRYSFTVTDSHRLPLAGLPAHPSTQQ
jgi:hypothetical protein